jgi:hypothetical protein
VNVDALQTFMDEILFCLGNRWVREYLSVIGLPDVLQFSDTIAKQDMRAGQVVCDRLDHSPIISVLLTAVCCLRLRSVDSLSVGNPSGYLLHLPVP